MLATFPTAAPVNSMAVFLIKNPRAVFIHIPKTGGASIRRGFFENNVEGPTHGSIPPEWEELFKFAFVRNPYDRIVSAWKMFAGGMENSVWKHPSDEAGIDLKSFLQIAMDESIPFDGNRTTTKRKIRHHAIPQSHPFNCLQYADFVGRFENLKTDFKTVCERLEISGEGLPHWNRSQRSSDFMQYFDEETLTIVNSYFADDFERWDYSMKR